MNQVNRPSRGYSAVGLWFPRDPLNVGSVLRASQCFGAALVAIRGKRYTRARTDTGKAYKHMPLLHVEEDLFSCVPFDCVPVAIEVAADATPLPDFHHPERAFYVFGPEDGSLPPRALEACRHIVSVPSGCLNLAACVNVVLYDRAAKQWREKAQVAA